MLKVERKRVKSKVLNLAAVTQMVSEARQRKAAQDRDLVSSKKKFRWLLSQLRSRRNKERVI